MHGQLVGVLDIDSPTPSALAKQINVAWKCSAKLSYGIWKKMAKFPANLFDAGYIFPGTGIDFYYFALFNEQRHSDHGAGRK